MAKFDPEIHDDNPPMDAAFMAGMKPSRRGRPKSEDPKVEVKIRLDAKTVEHLRDSGPGWQTRVNPDRPGGAIGLWEFRPRASRTLPITPEK